MANNEIKIINRTTESIPYDLLLLADPSRKMIDKYLTSSDLFLAKSGSNVVGVLALKMEDHHAEIMNVAVAEEFQKNGIGSLLIKHAIQHCKENTIERLSIGTADTSNDQLRLYQKLGFAISGKIKNFFKENYPEPIYENGKQAKDMIRLEMSLS